MFRKKSTKNDPDTKKFRGKVLIFVLAVLLHGIYNYFAGFKMDSMFFWFSLVVVLVAVVECRIRYREMNPEGLILFQ